MERPKLIAATVTPFAKGETSLNEEAIHQMVEELCKHGLDGMYVGGSTGEAIYQDATERSEAYEMFSNANAGRLKLIAQVGGGSLQSGIELGRRAKSCGYHAISSLPPMYYGHGFEAIRDYYQQLTEEVGLPMVVYNFPAASGTDFTTAQLQEILSLPGVTGVKHTSLNLYQFERVLTQTKTQAYYGHDEQFLSALALSPYGFIGSTIGIMPHVYVNIFKAFASGDLVAARVWQTTANDVIDALIKVGVLSGVKAILTMDGIDCGTCRAPLQTVDDAGLDLLRKVMAPVWEARDSSA